MKTYLINLESASERLAASIQELQKIELPVFRVDAVAASNLQSDSFQVGNPRVAACWFSHVKALEIFLATQEDFGLIVEDDISIKNVEYFNKILLAAKEANLEVVQIGFIKPGLVPIFEVFFQKMEYKLLRFISAVALRNIWLPRRLRKIERLGKLSGAPFRFLIPNEFVAGTHCYLVNRVGAKKLISVNKPVILPSDGLIQGMVRSSAISGARAIKSAAGQRKTISSITQRITNF